MCRGMARTAPGARLLEHVARSRHARRKIFLLRKIVSTIPRLGRRSRIAEWPPTTPHPASSGPQHDVVSGRALLHAAAPSATSPTRAMSPGARGRCASMRTTAWSSRQYADHCPTPAHGVPAPGAEWISSAPPARVPLFDEVRPRRVTAAPESSGSSPRRRRDSSSRSPFPFVSPPGARRARGAGRVDALRMRKTPRPREAEPGLRPVRLTPAPARGAAPHGLRARPEASVSIAAGRSLETASAARR